MGRADAESTRRLVVEEDAGARLDVWLAARLPELSRSRVTQLLEQGCIQVNNSVPRKSYRPAAGDIIAIDLPAPVSTDVAAEPIPLNILYEDSDLLVLDKPAGLVVHPAPGHRSGTLVNALLHHVADLSGIGGVLRPGIVHRLDKDTSGLMVVAKNDDAHRGLSTALKRREISRIYLAAAWGHLQQDALEVDAPIARSRNDRKRMAVSPDGRSANTRFARLERWRAADLLRAELRTGRTHQIRVHLAHIGHPVVGDMTYAPHATRGLGGPDRGWALELSRRVPRQFLHAAELRFLHPRSGEPLEFSAALPPDLESAAQWALATSLAR
jgi:23S rRNA pseudouridine1911/1915/1917 synthase